MMRKTLAFVMIVCSNLFAFKYDFLGLYNWGDVLSTYCQVEKCLLSVPSEFAQLPVNLTIQTDNKNTALKGLKLAALAQNYKLIKTNNELSIRPTDPKIKYFLSCLDSSVIETNEEAYIYMRQSDSLKCLNKLTDIKNKEQAKQYIQDSLFKIVGNFKDYELKYFSFNKNFIDKMGVSWNEILLTGKLTETPKLFDNWALSFQAGEDTSFIFRSVSFSIDTSLSIDWGTEEKEIFKTYYHDGLIIQDENYRNYGMIINIKRQLNRVTLDYTFRDKDITTTILQGGVIGKDSDTLRVSGHYTQNRINNYGIPFLHKIPFIGYLFKREEITKENRIFYIYLIPKGGKNEK